MDQVSGTPDVLSRLGPPSFDLTGWFNSLGGYWPHIVVVIKELFGIAIGLSFPISVFFLIGIIYSVEQLKRIRAKEKLMYDTKVEPAYEPVEGADHALAHRWDSITAHIASANPNDWKQAIIEADIMLDDILTKMGYRGESVGDKLKRVEKGDFRTLDDAWEAHKVRNSIAHEPGFALSEHEAKQTIARYRRVFEEFYYI